MSGDVSRYLTKITSMSNIKVSTLPKCESDIERLLQAVELNPNYISENELSDYERGILSFFGLGDIRDEEDGLFYLKDAADSGDADAMNLYGFACYHMSLGQNGDLRRKREFEILAKRYFMRGAELGQSEALFNLGVCYLEGKLGLMEEEEGRRLLEEAKAAGHPRVDAYRKAYESDHITLEELPRENGFSAEETLESVCSLLAEEMRDIPKGMTPSITGLVNDCFLAAGYQWKKKNDALGWLLTKDEGQTYLIRESELEELAKRLGVG